MLPKLLPVALVVAATTPQYTVQPQKVEMPSTNLLHLYSGKYWAVKDQTRFSPGADLRRSRTPVSADTYRRSIRVLDDYIRAEAVFDQPVSAPVSASANTTVQAAVTYSTGGGGGGVPSCASESGTNYSTGPSNTNPQTGATGRYQELPMHRQPGGLCYGLDLSPAGQDRCAQIIYERQGAGAWVMCGG